MKRATRWRELLAVGVGASVSLGCPVGDWTYGVSLPASGTGLRPVALGLSRRGRRWGMERATRWRELLAVGVGASVDRGCPVGDWTYGVSLLASGTGLRPVELGLSRRGRRGA